MLKKIIKACAAASLVLVSGTAMGQANPLIAIPRASQDYGQEQQPAPAGPAVSTFVGDANGTSLVIQLTNDNGSVRGKIILGQQTFPCVGREQSGTLAGEWTNASGQRFPLQASMMGTAMRITTAGQSYTLMLVNAGGDGGQNPAPAPVQTPGIDTAQRPVGGDTWQRPAPATGTVDLNGVNTVGGDFFTIPVPSGWQATQGNGYACVISPDKHSAYGIIGQQVDPQTTPEQFMKTIFQGFGVRDLKVESTRPVPSSNGSQGTCIDALVRFTGGDGVERRGAVRVAVMPSANGSFAFFQHAATPAAQWERDGNALTTLVSQIRPAQQRPQIAPQPNGGGYDPNAVQPVNDRRYDRGGADYDNRYDNRGANDYRGVEPVRPNSGNW